MLTTLGEIKNYIKRLVQDTAKISVSDPLMTIMVNQIMLDIADVTSYMLEKKSLTLTAGTASYTVDDLGIRETFLRPDRVLYGGQRLDPADIEILENGGYLDPDATSGIPVKFSWIDGTLSLYPTPSSAATKQVSLYYIAVPADMTADTDTLNIKFRPQWTNCLCWGILEQVLAATPVKEDDVRLQPNFAAKKYAELLERARKDAAYIPAHAEIMQVRQRGARKDANYFTDQLGYN